MSLCILCSNSEYSWSIVLTRRRDIHRYSYQIKTIVSKFLSVGKLNRVNIQIYKRERNVGEKVREGKNDERERWRETERKMRERQSERGVDLLGGGMRGGAWLTLGGGGRNGGGGMFGGRGPGGKKGGILLGFGSASDDECSEIT